MDKISQENELDQIKWTDKCKLEQMFSKQFSKPTIMTYKIKWELKLKDRCSNLMGINAKIAGNSPRTREHLWNFVHRPCSDRIIVIVFNLIYASEVSRCVANCALCLRRTCNLKMEAQRRGREFSKDRHAEQVSIAASTGARAQAPKFSVTTIFVKHWYVAVAQLSARNIVSSH